MQTRNLTNIDPALLQRLDHAVYSSKTPPTQDVLERANLYRTELLDLLRTYNPTLAEHYIKHPASLYNLYCWVDRVIHDDAEFHSERRHAQIHNAHTQRYPWDK